MCLGKSQLLVGFLQLLPASLQCSLQVLDPAHPSTQALLAGRLVLPNLLRQTKQQLSRKGHDFSIDCMPGKFLTYEMKL